MPSRNDDLTRDARFRFARGERIDMSTDAAQATVVVYDPNRDIRIHSIEFAAVLAGDTGSCAHLLVGTAADPDHYCDMTPTETAEATALGTTQVATLLSRDLLPAGTPLIATRVTGSKTNTWECVPVITYEFIDRTLSH